MIGSNGRLSKAGLVHSQVVTHLDGLPHVRLWVDDAHVRLIGSTVDEETIVQLQKSVISIVLSCECRRPVQLRILGGLDRMVWTDWSVQACDRALGEGNHEELLVDSCNASDELLSDSHAAMNPVTYLCLSGYWEGCRARIAQDSPDPRTAVARSVRRLFLRSH